MTENQTKSPRSEAPLVPLFHTILATQNKASELFVKSFQYQGENIATKHLGQIFGFFEIPDTQEDNAYIVNFLASVVKKEYFVNPKRSATDSFEAALHKINLALTELVKQGNTAWLGNLHGVVSVITNNTFHFSVTGDASILLYRDNQVNLISEGLADKDAALHPLKTFLEISSGALLANDKILLTSPELFSLCEPETLRKNAFRMDKNGFARFVRAAIINELPLGVSLIIDMEPGQIPVAPKKKAKELREESLEKLQNVFSDSSFKGDTARVSPEEKEEAAPEEEEIPVEYTDHKTGHIYVQGQVPHTAFKEPARWQIFLEEWILPLWITLWNGIKRLSKKSRKTVAKQASVLGVEGKELSLTLWKASKEKTKFLAQKGNSAIKNSVVGLSKKTSQNFEQDEPSFDGLLSEEEFPEETFSSPAPEEIPTPLNSRQAALHKFSPLYERPERIGQLKTFSFKNSLSFIKSIPRSIFWFLATLISRVKNFSLKQKLLLGAGIALIIMIPFFIKNTPSEDLSQAPQESSSSVQETASTETQVMQPGLGDRTTLTSWSEGPALLIAKSGPNTAVVSPKAVTLDGKAFPFPADGTIQSATYMTDLRLIFLWSNKGELVSWSIVDQKYTANTLPLPANTTVSALGSYLTYLYVLDKNNGTIYRFARTEGGFGEPTTWLRTPLAKGSAQSFVITDVIRIATDTTLDQYLRGVKEKTITDKSYQVLGLSNEKNFTLGIETASGKLTVWNAEGISVYEGTFEELKGVSAVNYHEGDKKLLITKDQNLLEYSLRW